MLSKRRSLAAVSFAALSLLAACGGSGSSGNPAVEASADAESNPAVNLRELVSSSVTKAAGINSSRFSMEMSVPGPEGAAFDVSGTGAIDSAAPFMTMEMDMGSMVPGMDGKMSMLFDGKVFYMKFPAFAAAMGDKQWVRFDLESLSKMSGMDFEGLLSQFEQSDPKANLAMLTGASDDITEVGREDVRGVSTRHFKMTVNMQKSLEGAPDELRDAVANAAEQMGVSTFPGEIWIDDEDLPRRLSYTMDLSKAMEAAGGAATGPMQMTMDLFDYGTKVDATLPPASETADFFEFIGRMAGNGMRS